jgi:hypothetical protein
MSHSHSGNNNTQSICELLGTLPPGYPVSEVVVDGFSESVNAFITLDQNTNLAYFSEVGGGLVVADCRRISLIDFA